MSLAIHRRFKLHIISAFFGVFCVFSAQIHSIEWKSANEQTILLELYTSEGCSSCPPADRWLTRFTHSPRLWKEIVPVALHVDYWDKLGWKDKFAQAAFGKRQLDYMHLNYISSIYTPEILLNGREWRDYFRGKDIPESIQKIAGPLYVLLEDNTLTAKFKPNDNVTETLILKVAQLGFDVQSTITSGENSDNVLIHDFVVLSLQSAESERVGNEYNWRMAWLPSKQSTKRSGIAAWIAKSKDPTPLQATGGFL